MTITQLTTFLKIAETGNFSAAADLLGYAQSTVTMQIKQLEDELGCELFDRLGKTVSLTAAGERLLRYAEQMKQLEQDILSDVPDTDEPAGILKIGVSESLCYKHFPHCLMEYGKKYPNVDIRIAFVTHDDFPEMLKKGMLDIVYTLNPLIVKDDLKLLYKHEESLGFYASPDHPLARKKRVTEKDLAGVPLLLTGHNCSFRKMLTGRLKEHGIEPSVALETSSKEILKQFASNGMGIAFIPDMSAENVSGKLVRIKWTGENFPVYSQVFVHKDKNINRAMQEMISMIGKTETGG